MIKNLYYAVLFAVTLNPSLGSDPLLNDQSIRPRTITVTITPQYSGEDLESTPGIFVLTHPEDSKPCYAYNLKVSISLFYKDGSIVPVSRPLPVSQQLLCPFSYDNERNLDKIAIQLHALTFRSFFRNQANGAIEILGEGRDLDFETVTHVFHLGVHGNLYNRRFPVEMRCPKRRGFYELIIHHST